MTSSTVFRHKRGVLSIEQDDDENLIVRSQGRGPARLAWSIALIGVFVCGIGGVIMPVVMLLDANDRDEFVWSMIFFGVFGVLGIVLAVVSPMAWAQTQFTRRFSLDSRSRVCQFHHVPGFGCVIPFDDIDSVVLCFVDFRGWRLAYLCFAVRGWKRYFSVHQIPRRGYDSEAVPADLEAVARRLSQLLDCPIERRGEVGVFQLSWR